ncbi:PII, uridylyltransferase [Actinidia rufa]|uniref:RING-type E3 ubiquitin transferase n=1 Tax=Actinidia rufa TaxID=165716 RepID=A0A7J0FZI7_9ERIC|nr:PII, uridylyltransferase [Actinidia rufa]
MARLSLSLITRFTTSLDALTSASRLSLFNLKIQPQSWGFASENCPLGDRNTKPNSQYDRIDEAKRECAFVLDSALELKPGYNWMNGIGIKEELSFINGDWWQEANGVSLMPFDGRDVPNNSSTRLNLVSFWVSDVDRSHRSDKSVSVSGVMQMGIYTESKDNGEERVLCLLGNAMLSSRDPESADQWEFVKGFAIRGRKKSLNPKSNIKYFDEVHISSGLGTSAKYEFSSDKIVSKVCHPYPYEDRLMKGGFDIYKGLDFCLILERFTQGEAMIVLPNWQCNGADDFCSKLDPFGSDKEIKATNGSFKDVKLVLQDVQCEKELSRDNGDFLRVSAVFRAVSPCEKHLCDLRKCGINTPLPIRIIATRKSIQPLAVLEKNEPFNFGSVIKKSLLKFPKLEDTQAFLVSLSLLSEDLTLHISAFPDPIPKSRPSRTDVQMEIVSLGPLFGRYWSSGNSTISEEETPYHSKAEYTEKQLLLNVSAQLTLTGTTPDNNISVLFLEGLYDQHVGQMYLIGCRDIRASWRILHESMDLEDGLDCLVEVVVKYPPTMARWKQREDILSRRGVEGILRILTLSLAISCILSQLFFIRENLDYVLYVSLIMLGVQALGYSLPLITGAEAIFKRMETLESYEIPSYDLQKSQWLQVIDYIVKLLVLVSFSLTLRICQKVWKSRVRFLTRGPSRTSSCSKREVGTSCNFDHTFYWVRNCSRIIHLAKTSQRPLRTERFVDSTGNSQTLREWETELEEYVGLIQDFFLLPQIIGNLIWQIHCKPLKKLYFVGMTVVKTSPSCLRLLEISYSHFIFLRGIQVCESTSTFNRSGVMRSSAGLLRLGDISVYRWVPKYMKDCLSQSVEAELVAGVNGDAEQKKEHIESDDLT